MGLRFIGAFSLFGAATGIVDYTARLAADVLRTSYLKGRNESRIYFTIVWTLVLIGVAVLLTGFSQPLVLLVISACTGGTMMFIYSFLLIRLNRRLLVHELRPTGYRIGALVWGFLLFWRAVDYHNRSTVAKALGSSIAVTTSRLPIRL